MNARSRRLPHGAAMAVCVVIAPLLGGCVSAVDESQSFGFASASPATAPSAPPTTPSGDAAGSATMASPSDEKPTTVATANAEKKPVSKQDDEIATLLRSPTATRVAEIDRKDGAEAAANAEANGGIAPTALLSRTSAPAVAAYATPARGGKESENSLYASLFTQSEAKTPLKNADAGKGRRVVVLQTQGSPTEAGGNALPGVDPKSLFEIGQRASVDSDLMDDIGGSYQMASLSGIARLAPSGLLIQREDIVTNCFDSNLMALIGQIEGRFKKKVVITSGFRSPAHNRRVNGAKASMHMACKAADLHVPGVDGRAVAEYVRALPQRGGVGTYCHTAAIHIDSGPTRDWNWPCRTRRFAAVKDSG